MIRQLLHILMCLSLVHINITSIVFDAGGNNRRLHQLLMHGKTQVENGRLERISFPKMFLGAGHPIFVWYCSTRNLKSCRNQLLTSSGKDNAARQFHDRYNVFFGWQNIVEQWKREHNRTNRGELPLTKLSLSSVYPDTWKKMRATHANAIFTQIIRRIWLSLLTYWLQWWYSEYNNHTTRNWATYVCANKNVLTSFSKSLRSYHISLQL